MTAATTDLSPDEGLTAGSLSIQHSGAALRQVCAEVRDMFVGIAADKLAVPKEELTIEDGQISARTAPPPATGNWPTTRCWTGPQVVTRRRSRVGLPRRRHQRRKAGSPRQARGRPRYVHDLTLNGMVYGRGSGRRRAARRFATSTPAQQNLPSVIAVVRDGSFLAVVAERDRDRALAAAHDQQGPARRQPRHRLGQQRHELAHPVHEHGQRRHHRDRGGGTTTGLRRRPLTHRVLPSPVPRARLDRTLLRGRARRARPPRDLDAQPGSTHVAPRDRASAGDYAGPPRGPARRRRWLLRPQRRRRRSDGCRNARPRRTGPTGAGGVVATRRVELVPARTRWRRADLGGLWPRRQRVVMAPRDLEWQLHQPPRHDTEPRVPGGQPPRGRRGDPLGG
jgi:hypothetical protein